LGVLLTAAAAANRRQNVQFCFTRFRLPPATTLRQAFVIAPIFGLDLSPSGRVCFLRRLAVEATLLKPRLYAEFGNLTAGLQEVQIWGVCPSAPSGRLTFGTDMRFFTNRIGVFQK
jgi:hypothetical protein